MASSAFNMLVSPALLCKPGTGDRPDLPVHVLSSTGKTSSQGGGSLPESPQSEGFVPDFSGATTGALEEETRTLLRDFYRGYTGQKILDKHSALDTMDRVTRRVLLKHRIAYKGMVERLCLEQKDDRMEFVSDVSESLFSDGTTNWGRIASLLGFGAVVCDHLKAAGRERCVDTVALNIATYLNTHQQQWLINNKAWDGFVLFFREDDTESRVWNTLVTVAGIASLGAGLALLVR